MSTASGTQRFSGADRAGGVERVEARRRGGDGGADYGPGYENVGGYGAWDAYSAELRADLGKARKLAWLMDSQFTFMGVRFGLDPVIGLLPVVGDTVTAAVGAYMVYVAVKHKLGAATIALMVVNLLADWLVGLVPWLGDMADVAFKGHLWNFKLLERGAARKYGGR